jgi:hypothetical protein
MCANLYRNNPPEYTLSKSIYVNNFKKFYELENAILIICHINKNKNTIFQYIYIYIANDLSH